MKKDTTNYKNGLSYFYKTKRNGKTIDRYQTHSLRRFRNRIGTINWGDLIKNGGGVYLKVNYGRHFNNFGKKTTFYNDGIYLDKESFCFALNVFLEK